MKNSLGFNDMKSAVDVVVHSGHVPNIVGLQGIGKSALVRKYCESKGYFYREITCSLLQEGDLAMPFIKEVDNSKDVGYAISGVIKEVSSHAESSGTYSILFLDEFNRASSNVQSELMNIVLQRELVGYKLNENVRIILAMNPSAELEGFEETDYSVSSSDAAIMGRVDTLILEVKLKDWLNYGKVVTNGSQRIHKNIIGYLKGNKEDFITKEVVGRLNNTPRGWSRASDILYSYERIGYHDTKLLLSLLSGTLCMDTAISLVNYLTMVRRDDAKDADLNRVVFYLKMDDLEDSLGSFKSLQPVDQVLLMNKGMDYLESTDPEVLEYTNYIMLLKTISIDLRFSLLDVISENQELLSGLSAFDDFQNMFLDFSN